MITASVLLAVACIPVPTCETPMQTDCATPTPVVQWEAVAHTALAGYKVYAQEPGGPLILIATLPCDWRDVYLDGDDVADEQIQVCPGADYGVPVTRFLDQNRLYSLTVTAYTETNQESVMPSQPIEICMPPLCVAPGPCS